MYARDMTCNVRHTAQPPTPPHDPVHMGKRAHTHTHTHTHSRSSHAHTLRASITCTNLHAARTHCAMSSDTVRITAAWPGVVAMSPRNICVASVAVHGGTHVTAQFPAWNTGWASNRSHTSGGVVRVAELTPASEPSPSPPPPPPPTPALEPPPLPLAAQAGDLDGVGRGGGAPAVDVWGATPCRAACAPLHDQDCGGAGTTVITTATRRLAATRRANRRHNRARSASSSAATECARATDPPPCVRLWWWRWLRLPPRLVLR